MPRAAPPRPRRQRGVPVPAMRPRYGEMAPTGRRRRRCLHDGCRRIRRPRRRRRRRGRRRRTSDPVRRLPVDGLLGRGQPHVEEVLEVLARDLLGERGEVRRRGRAAAEALDPCLARSRRTPRRRPPCGARAASPPHGRRSGRRRARAAPGRRRRRPRTPSIVGRDRHDLVEATRCAGGSAPVLGPHPLASSVAQPSLSQMSAQRYGLTSSPIHWCAQLVGDGALASVPREERPGLRLERVADRVVVDDGAVRVERVRAVQALEEDEHVARLREVGGRRSETRRDPPRRRSACRWPRCTG